jgi:hypothetical protein
MADRPKKFYHCTDSQEHMDQMLEHGYESTLTTFLAASLTTRFHGKLTPEDLAYLARFPWSEANEQPFERARNLISHRRFGHGTVIWLSTTPEVNYGDYCFEVKPPKGALLDKEGASSMTDGEYWLMWTPMKPIPQKYFRLLENEEIDKFYQTDSE